MKTGKRHKITDEERAKLEPFREQIMERLRADGITADWLADRSGVGAPQCHQWLDEMGGYWHYKGLGVYRIPTLARKYNLPR